MTKATKGFVIAIASVGILRFALDLAGLPHQTVKFFSMSAIMTAAAVYLAIEAPTHKKRLVAAYWIVLPYMVIEVLALTFTWISARATIFHTSEYSFGTTIAVHTLGHLIGGLTWEPLSIFLFMELIWLIFIAVKRLTGSAKHANA